MTTIELQHQIQRKAMELPADLLQEVFDYMEMIARKRQGETSPKNIDLEKWWSNLSEFSNDFMRERNQPPLDKSEELFE